MGDASRDTRLYEICSPIYHGKGVHFVRTFSPAFLAGLALKRDKFSNLRMHLRGLDPGGTPAMTAAQIAAAPGTIPGANPHQGSNAELASRAINELQQSAASSRVAASIGDDRARLQRGHSLRD